MPRIVSSLAAGPASREKENVAPQSKSHTSSSSSSAVHASFGKSAKRTQEYVSPYATAAKRRPEDPVAKQRSSPQRDTAHGRMAQSSASSSSRRAVTTRRRSSEARTSAEQAREHNGSPDALARAQIERDQVQAQFEELRELRMTEPERVLGEWKKASEEHNRNTDEYIASLKKDLDMANARRKGTPPEQAHHSTQAEADDLRKRLQESKGRESKLQEEVARLQRRLSEKHEDGEQGANNAATSRLALCAHAGSGVLGAGDERAIRRLYEDLTGLVVNKVEAAQVDRSDKDAPRRFHAIFACAGYHDLEIKLEESTSSVSSSSTSGTTARRQDFVYTPVFDQDRDAELLQSGKLPDYLCETIRFERSTAVKFLNTLHKRLDRHSKR